MWTYQPLADLKDLDYTELVIRVVQEEDISIVLGFSPKYKKVYVLSMNIKECNE